MQCLLVAPLMMVLFLFSVDRHDGAFGRSYTGKTFLSRQLSYTRSLSLLGAVQRRTTQMVANGRIAQRVSLQRSMLSVRMPGHVLGTSGSLHLIGNYLSSSKKYLISFRICTR